VISPLQRKLIRDLWGRKGSLIALVVIMAIGVGAFVGMASVWRDLDEARRDYYRNQRLADFVVDLKRVPQWAVAGSAALPNVSALRGRVRQAVLMELPGVARPIPGSAISLPLQRRPVLNDVLLRAGGWFSETHEREVLLDHAFAEAHGLRPGDRIKALLLDRQHELLVVGIVQSPEFVYLIPPDGGFAPDPARFGVIYATEDFLRNSGDLRGAWNQLIGTLHDDSPSAVANSLALLADRLDPFGVTLTTSMRDDPSVRYLEDELAGLHVQSRVMPVLFLGVAALVLNVLLGRLVAQQRTVIGTLRALGYPAGAVTRHYLTYGLAVGLAGGLAGLAMGLWIQAEMVAMYHGFFALPKLAPRLHPDVALVGLGISVLFALAGTWKGVRGAARLAPADAMRPPPPERGGRVLPERIPALWRRIPFTGRMVLRAVFRNPFRSLVSVLAAAVSTALVFTALSMVDALDYLMRYEFERVAHQDFTVALREPDAAQAKAEVARLPNVAGTEAQLSVVSDLSRGAHRKRTGVMGLPPGNRLYTPLGGDGQPLVMPDAGLVLTRKLAEILHARPGDTLRLRPLIGRRAEVEAVVSGVTESFFGLTAYADIRYLSRLLGEAEAANAVLGELQPGTTPAALLEALKERPTVVGIGERRRAFTLLEESFGETMGTMIGVMVLFSGTIAFGSVLNAALVSLSERQREVATLRTLGYRAGQVARLFAGEGLVLNGAGLITGLFAGVGLAHLLSLAYSTELYRFPAVILPGTLALSAVLVALFVIAAQLILYRMIRRLDWLAVLNVKE
jgi:putative ABC transport system permease protein